MKETLQRILNTLRGVRRQNMHKPEESVINTSSERLPGETTTAYALRRLRAGGVVNETSRYRDPWKEGNMM